MTVDRKVFCEDAITWLNSNETLMGCSVIASLPDISEFQQFTLDQWKSWFTETAQLILSRCPDDGVAIFYQTDIKVDGRWVDKSYLCQKAAEKEGHQLIWHKIICRGPAGTITFGRPAYSHILCFSKGVKADLSKSTADVIPLMGDKTWERGMGFEACVMIAKFIASQTSTRTVVHPFCGEGGMLAIANFEGLSAVGIERSPKRAEKARTLTVDEDLSKWV